MRSLQGTAAKSGPCSPQTEKVTCSNEGPAQPKHKLINKQWKTHWDFLSDESGFVVLLRWLKAGPKILKHQPGHVIRRLALWEEKGTGDQVQLWPLILSVVAMQWKSGEGSARQGSEALPGWWTYRCAGKVRCPDSMGRGEEALHPGPSQTLLYVYVL